MKNRLWKMMMVSGLLVSAMAVSGVGPASVLAAEETEASDESGDDLQILFDEAVKDAMIIDKDEILPVVSLDEGDPMLFMMMRGRILLDTFHEYPDSYPDGADRKTGNGEMYGHLQAVSWRQTYQENKDSVTDWQTRLKELIGLRPDNESNYFTAMWAKPEDVFRPAYVSDIGTVEMTDSFSEDVNEEYKAWFDDNIISSYFDGAYPSTRLAYTYDWGR